MYQDINYNLFVGQLPEEVKLDKIGAIFSAKLRKLPIKEQYEDPYHGIQTMSYNSVKTKKVLHKGQNKRFFNLQGRLSRKIKNHPFIIGILF